LLLARLLHLTLPRFSILNDRLASIAKRILDCVVSDDN
jgi:hypothetical protein